MTNIANCVRNHTRGCSSISLVPMNFYFEWLQGYIQPCNTFAPIDIEIRPSVDRMDTRITKELAEFVRGVRDILVNSRDFQTDFCMLKMKMYRYFNMTNTMMPALEYMFYNDMAAGGMDDMCSHMMKEGKHCFYVLPTIVDETYIEDLFHLS